MVIQITLLTEQDHLLKDIHDILNKMICLFVLGFGMLESGCVSIKNEVNIMMKNVVDIVLGGKNKD